MKKCPYCAEEIQDQAIICRYCGNSLTEKQVIKRKGIAVPAFIFGLVIGVLLFFYNLSLPPQYPQYGIDGYIINAFMSALSSIFIYAGIFAFIAWIIRGLIKPIKGQSRFAYGTGFRTLMVCIGALLSMRFFMLMANKTNYESLAATPISYQPAPTMTNLDSCNIKQQSYSYQISIDSTEPSRECTNSISGKSDFYNPDIPDQGTPMCAYTFGSNTITIRDYAPFPNSVSNHLCQWMNRQLSSSPITVYTIISEITDFESE